MSSPMAKLCRFGQESVCVFIASGLEIRQGRRARKTKDVSCPAISAEWLFSFLSSLPNFFPSACVDPSFGCLSVDSPKFSCFRFVSCWLFVLIPLTYCWWLLLLLFLFDPLWQCILNMPMRVHEPGKSQEASDGKKCFWFSCGILVVG